MSVRGLSDLIVSIMAAGEVAALPARDHRSCHAALRSLLESDSEAAADLWSGLGDRPTTRPDAAVGVRVYGVTQALWEAVERGLLLAREDVSGDGAYVLAPGAAAASRRALLRLPVDQAELIYRCGAMWAAASTSRKKTASALVSPAATRRSRRA